VTVSGGGRNWFSGGLQADFMSIEAVLYAGPVIPLALSSSSNALQTVPAMRKG
jgi:hypothetical protein